MTLRKKFSRKFSKANIKAESAPPTPPTPPAPEPVKVLTLPTVRPTSPILDASSPLVRRTTRKRIHRRSRSFSALTPPTAAFAAYTPSRDSVYSQYSNHSNYSIDQPWRSQETWRALHTPPPHPSSPLKYPSALSSGSGGWRGKVGEGFFAGRNTPRPRRKTLDGGEEEQHTIDSSDAGEWKGSRGELMYKLQGLQLDRNLPSSSTMPRSTTGIRSSPLKTALLPSPSVPDFSHSSSASEESHSVQTPVHPHGGHHHQRNESLLPPLLPINVQNRPLRSSSFTALRSRPTLTPRESFGDIPASAAMPAAIPWGRRSSIDRRSTSPTLGKPPIPQRSALRAPQKALPAPPPAQLMASPEEDELCLSETEDDFDADASHSYSPVRERLTTPVTPPAGVGRRDTNKSYASGWSSNAGSRSGMGSRQPSWATVESREKNRGGWI